jgi:hypothetical protein
MARSTANRQEVAALHLAGGASVRAAARAAGVSERAVHGWLAEAPFASRVLELRTAMTQQAAAIMARGMTKAAKRLLRLLDSDREAVQLQAAKALLELAVKIRNEVEIEARLAALERQHQQNRPTGEDLRP